MYTRYRQTKDRNSSKLLHTCLLCIQQHFQASRAHLYARSSVLQAMFASNLGECEENRVLIVDFNADIVKHFVDYIHTGRVNEQLDANGNVELLRIADKYDVKGLKKFAVDRLVPQLSLDNIAAIFNFAAPLQDVDELTQACSKFMVKHRSSIKENEVSKSLNTEAANLLINTLL